MKWFFGFNEETEWFDNYFRYIKCAVNSAKANTSLDPHFLYDGKPNILTEYLEHKNVKVHYIRSRFYNFFHSLEQKGLNAKVASGAYLRAEIPEIATDQFVLYTDCDVMFTGDVSYLYNIRPKHFACAPEFVKDNWSYFNSGVMLMNTKSMSAKMPMFEKLVRGSSVSKLSKSYDQESYNDLYKGRWDRLPIEYNWKPYWGLNKNAKIIHFHGLKIENIERIMQGQIIEPILSNMFRKEPLAYNELYKLAVSYERV